MLFNSLKYALFLPIVVLTFWLSPPRLRVPILLIASYVFYMSWRPVYILLILTLTVFNYFVALALGHLKKQRRLLLIVALAGNLGTLAFFKYAYFLRDVLATASCPLNIAFPAISMDIILPLGISFFVFEFIHYIVDVYHGSPPVKSFLAFSLFASFFPTQIAGPIKRFQDFVPQFLARAKFSVDFIDAGMSLILLGLFKKVIIADNLSLLVMGGFLHPQLFTGLDLWLITYAFAFQIYFDFSGYTDIARGSARLFGYEVPINFNLPYLASSITDFWHRWHISLSTWLRDYLFIPLGGSHGRRFATYRNLFITMAIGGLWHGAAAHFFAWGIYHGILLIAHKEFKRLSISAKHLTWLLSTTWGHWFSVVVTFHAVCLGWVLFRAESLASAWEITKKMMFLEPLLNSVPTSVAHFSHIFSAQLNTQYFTAMNLPTINYPLIYPAIYIVLPLLALAHVFMAYFNSHYLSSKMPKFLKVAYCATLMFIILVFSPDKSPRFIYFQF